MYFSPKSKLFLTIKNPHIELTSLEFSSDQIFSSPITSGSLSIGGNILTLNGNNKKKYVLKIESEEILTPEKLEGTTGEDEFLAWIIYYNNGNDRQNGGWNDDNPKERVWSYFDRNEKKKNHMIRGDPKRRKF